MSHLDNLNTIVKDTYFNYRNCLIERLVGGMRWNNKKYTNYKDLDKDIDAALLSIQTSIKKGQQQ